MNVTGPGVYILYGTAVLGKHGQRRLTGSASKGYCNRVKRVRNRGLTGLSVLFGGGGGFGAFDGLGVGRFGGFEPATDAVADDENQ